MNYCAHIFHIFCVYIFKFKQDQSGPNVGQMWAKPGQIEPNRAKWGQTGPKGGKLGQTGPNRPNGANRAKWDQTGLNGTNRALYLIPNSLSLIHHPSSIILYLLCLISYPLFPILQLLSLFPLPISETLIPHHSTHIPYLSHI